MRNVLSYGLAKIFSCLFTQYKFVKEEIFMNVLQKHKLNPPQVHKITKKLYKILK